MWVFCMDRECECRVLVWLNIFLIRFLKFSEEHTLQLHLSRNELSGFGPVVHKGVHFVSLSAIRTNTNSSSYIVVRKLEQA